MDNHNSNHLHIARYITIAMDIAERVKEGDYKEGQKFQAVPPWPVSITYRRKLSGGLCLSCMKRVSSRWFPGPVCWWTL